MTGGQSRTPYIVAIFGLSVLASFVVLNRWLVTDIGLLSFGRVWQFYISYEDFGFIRRALVGTLFSITGVNTLFPNEYHFALLVQHVAILGFAGLIFSYIHKRGIEDVPFVATIALSPALIIQSGYTTGSLDIFVLILAAVNILYCRRLIPFCIVLITGVLVHELFVFTIPAQLVACYIHLRQQGRGDLFVPMALAAASALSAVVVVAAFGVTDLDVLRFESVMEAKLPFAAGQHDLWSGYYEVSQSASDNISDTTSTFAENMIRDAIFLAIPCLYIALVISRLATCSRSGLEKAMLVGSSVFPLFAALVATDLYRWIGMSANIGLLLTLFSVGQGFDARPKFTVALLPFCLLAPLGAAQTDWPFPIHQSVWQALIS